MAKFTIYIETPMDHETKELLSTIPRPLRSQFQLLDVGTLTRAACHPKLLEYGDTPLAINLETGECRGPGAASMRLIQDYIASFKRRPPPPPAAPPVFQSPEARVLAAMPKRDVRSGAAGGGSEFTKEDASTAFRGGLGSLSSGDWKPDRAISLPDRRPSSVPRSDSSRLNPLVNIEEPDIDPLCRYDDDDDMAGNGFEIDPRINAYLRDKGISDPMSTAGGRIDLRDVVNRSGGIEEPLPTEESASSVDASKIMDSRMKDLSMVARAYGRDLGGEMSVRTDAKTFAPPSDVTL